MAHGSESLFGSMLNYSSNSLPNGDSFNTNGIHQHDPNSFADLVAQLGFLLGGVNLGAQPTANAYSGFSSCFTWLCISHLSFAHSSSIIDTFLYVHCSRLLL